MESFCCIFRLQVWRAPNLDTWSCAVCGMDTTILFASSFALFQEAGKYFLFFILIDPFLFLSVFIYMFLFLDKRSSY